MGFWLLLGCCLIAYGPAAVLVSTFVARRSQLVIIAISAAFFWLISILITGVLWYFIPFLRDHYASTIPVSVFIQESGRFGFVWLYSRAEVAITKKAFRRSVVPLNDASSSISAGVGFGVMYALVMYGGTIGVALEPADYFTEACPHLSIFILSAFNALFVQIMHISLMVTAFHAWRGIEDAKKRRMLIGTVFAVHLAGSFASLINTSSCAFGIPLFLAVSAASAALAASVLRGTT